MKIAVIGTGFVGQALAGRLDELGHAVTMGTRNPEETRNREGNSNLSNWLNEHSNVALKSFNDALADAEELIVFAMNGKIALECLSQMDASHLKGKIMIDISNPLDFSNGFPPSLTVCNTESLAEQIQAAYPDVKVVKTLNTMTNPIMVNPALLEGDHVVFMSGNEDTAKLKVKEVLKSFGWREDTIIDLGDLSTARGTEMLLPLWVRLYGKWQTAMFNFAINRSIR